MAKRTIIYAEDNDDMREITTELMKRMGYEVHAHENGQLALEDVRARTAKGEQLFLLTDHNMPEMTGVELVKALSDAKIRVPTILLSANDEVNSYLTEAGVADKVDRVMMKPFDLRLFTEALATISAKHDALLPKGPVDFATRADAPYAGRT
jgi:two-component system chemotaxis response regulator CheY